tara:strand:+ start:12554 stop:13393 length:840 start_codon:yes stop_codon:yes gene_type:complete
MIENQEFKPLLETTKVIAESAAKELLQSLNSKHYEHKYDERIQKEVKATVDRVLENLILPELLKTGYSVLSEESGNINNSKSDGYQFILDPLDGTYNFLRNSGPSAISISFVKIKDSGSIEFIFGVIFDLLNEKLFWGGKQFGSFSDNIEILVSDTRDLNESVLFTGFPARFDFKMSKENMWSLYKDFAKVRMIGSAAISLTHVANGSADSYFENNIMLWDVAAGIALVEGAGGQVKYRLNGQSEDLFDCPVLVLATNTHLLDKLSLHDELLETSGEMI